MLYKLIIRTQLWNLSYVLLCYLRFITPTMNDTLCETTFQSAHDYLVYVNFEIKSLRYITRETSIKTLITTK